MNEVRELIDTELDAVCGGGFVDINLPNININASPQFASQVAVAIGGTSVFGDGGAAKIDQLLAQTGITAFGK
jgi:hypothetical protein